MCSPREIWGTAKEGWAGGRPPGRLGGRLWRGDSRVQERNVEAGEVSPAERRSLLQALPGGHHPATSFQGARSLGRRGRRAPQRARGLRNARLGCAHHPAEGAESARSPVPRSSSPGVPAWVGRWVSPDPASTPARALDPPAACGQVSPAGPPACSQVSPPGLCPSTCFTPRPVFPGPLASGFPGPLDPRTRALPGPTLHPGSSPRPRPAPPQRAARGGSGACGRRGAGLPAVRASVFRLCARVVRPASGTCR